MRMPHGFRRFPLRETTDQIVQERLELRHVCTQEYIHHSLSLSKKVYEIAIRRNIMSGLERANVIYAPWNHNAASLVTCDSLCLPRTGSKQNLVSDKIFLCPAAVPGKELDPLPWSSTPMYECSPPQSGSCIFRR